MFRPPDAERSEVLPTYLISLWRFAVGN